MKLREIKKKEIKAGRKTKNEQGMSTECPEGKRLKKQGNRQDSVQKLWNQNRKKKK